MQEHTLTGNIQSHPDFESRVLGNRRDVLVYLPPGYRRSRTRRFPVMYLHDGQNVFDAATAFGGNEWGADETAQRLVNQKLIEPVIIVAVANTGENRIHEYTPTRGRLQDGKRKRSRGLLRQYGSFLINELKPFIDARYRTLTEADYTGLGGSSLGGLATIVLGLWFPNVFRRLAVMSPSIWWDNCVLLDMIEELDEELKPPLKIWLDTGTNEPGWERARVLRDGLVEKGWRLYDDLHYFEDEGAGHTEAAWGHRIDAALRFLYPPPPPMVVTPRRRRVRPIVIRRTPFAVA
ncbi:MAG TPA: alpha/beta hydrolase-fold protein [Chthoniobacterales bacterium]|nr:alpha/beta hydrolase-fold protein [Chthoniobacterales bacterium]